MINLEFQAIETYPAKVFKISNILSDWMKKLDKIPHLVSFNDLNYG